MGWSNYIVVDKLKLIFEISRDVSYETLPFINEEIDRIETYLELLPLDSFEEKLVDVDVLSFAKYLLIAKATNSLFALADGYLDVYFFLRFLSSYNLSYRVVSEFSFDKGGDDEGLDVKYTVINRFYGDD